MNFKELSKRTNDEIQELAIKVKSGDYKETERNRLASLIYPKLKYFIWKFFNDEEETSHALMETCEKIFNNIHTFNPQYRFTTWAFTIARNQALYHIDQVKKKVKPMVSIDDVSPLTFEIADGYYESFERESLKTRLYQATMMEIENLPDSIEKTLLIEKDINLLKGEDIAVKYEMNLNTVKTKLRKARKIVRSRVLQENPDLQDRIFELV